jgi:phospholipid/cholesterol/gamma-HCH transport system substrate-binding protein
MLRSLGGKYQLGHGAYSLRERLAGTIIILVAILIITGSLITTLWYSVLKDYNTYFIVFNEGYGLIPGVKVRFLGLEIGSVTNVELLDNNKIRMDLRINTEYTNRIKGDSLAMIKSPTIIGAEYIEIQTGSEESLPIPNNGQIPAQDHNTIDQLITSMQLEQKIQQLDELLYNVTAIAEYLQDKQGPVRGAAENVKTLSDRILLGQGSLGAILSREDAYIAILDTLNELKQVSINLNETSRRLNMDVPDLTKKVDSILGQVESGTRSIPEVAKGTREGIRDANQIIDSLKNNFLIRGNIPPATTPDNLTRPLRNQ